MSGGHGGSNGVLRGMVPPMMGLLGWGHGLGRGDWAGDWVPVVTFEPSDESTNGRVDLVSIAVPIRSK